ncbi:MAG: hypothetical protein IKP68_12530 [Clostridia bacterium]|nr:hypothetical protein [Clostridia bacterium]
MRLIDADAFESNMQNEWELGEISNGEWIRFREMINDEPTIDAVEVVRCKECKNAFNVEGEWICNHLSGMVGINVVVNSDDFCSYGEEAEK